MTVAVLIARLQALPHDLPVYLLGFTPEALDDAIYYEDADVPLTPYPVEEIVVQAAESTWPRRVELRRGETIV